jgi:hypothetical protein
LIGWGQQAFPGPRGDFWVTTLGPTAGAIAGGFFYDFVVLAWFPKEGVEAPPGRHEEEPLVAHAG